MMLKDYVYEQEVEPILDQMTYGDSKVLLLMVLEMKSLSMDFQGNGYSIRKVDLQFLEVTEKTLNKLEQV